MKIKKKKRELQQIASNRSSDVNFKEFTNLYKNIPQKHILC